MPLLQFGQVPDRLVVEDTVAEAADVVEARANRFALPKPESTEPNAEGA